MNQAVYNKFQIRLQAEGKSEPEARAEWNRLNPDEQVAEPKKEPAKPSVAKKVKRRVWGK